MAFFLATLNTACRRSKRFVKKNILSIAKVVTFEAKPKFWGMEYWRKRCKERTRWTISKASPVGVDVVARYYLSINFCASSSSWSYIIVASLPSLVIICYFFSRFGTLSSSCRCRAKAIWPSLGELIYHCLEHICCDLFLIVSFEKLSPLCCNNTERTELLSVVGRKICC